jgi:hypothetical protein
MLPTWSDLRDAPARARDRVRRVRDDGRERLWTIRTTALSRASDLIDRADDWPAVGRIASAAGKVVDRELDRLTAVPVEGWDELNARKAADAVAGLDRIGLVAARRREVATKNRVTVLRAIDARLGVPPEASASEAPVPA